MSYQNAEPLGAPRKYGRQEAANFLRRNGVREEETERVLRGIDFPVTMDTLRETVAERGVSLSNLMDQMGGSP